jgi:heme/copper-type cytochrome/quinol oxidase subunit 1
MMINGPGSWTRILTTNHKDIGSMYLWFSLYVLLAAAWHCFIRAELFQPGLLICSATKSLIFYKRQFTR